MKITDPGVKAKALSAARKDGARAAAKEFGLHRNTIFRWLKDERGAGAGGTARGRKSKYTPEEKRAAVALANAGGSTKALRSSPAPKKRRSSRKARGGTSDLHAAIAQVVAETLTFDGDAVARAVLTHLGRNGNS